MQNNNSNTCEQGSPQICQTRLGHCLGSGTFLRGFAPGGRQQHMRCRTHFRFTINVSLSFERFNQVVSILLSHFGIAFTLSLRMLATKAAQFKSLNWSMD